MVQACRRWRLAKRQGPKGIYWSLRTGRGDDRQALSLGYCSEEEAEAAREQLNIEEVHNRANKIVQWHAEDRAEALRYLFGDPVVRQLYEPRPDYGAMPLRDYYEEVYVPWRSVKRAKGWQKEQRLWRRINSAIGATPLRRVDPYVVADYLDDLIATTGPRAGQPASGNTKRLHRAALQALIKRAYRLKHIDSCPDFALFRLEGASKRVIDKPAPLNLEELEALMRASEPKHRAMWAVAAGQGLRPGELNRVRWEDVDLGARVLRVRGTKTEGADAVVPLTPLGHRELQGWWMQRGQPSAGLAFPSRNGAAYSDQGWKKALKNAAERAGIERRVYPYLLRDSFATIAWIQGIPLDIARRVMRHTADSRMLEEVYCRPRPEDVAKRIQAFDI